MAQPSLTGALTAGLGDAAVAYGYAMAGNALATCAAAAVVTTTLVSSGIFTGGKF